MPPATIRDVAEPRRAVVVGGSLGGLSAAVLLRDAGWDVTVYERSPMLLDGFGAGIVVHEATVRYLIDRAKVPLDQISCGSSVIRSFGADGDVVHEEPSSYRFTAWTTLYRGLLECLGAERYVLGECLADLRQGDTVAEAQFTSGRVEAAELVVCADGIASTARRVLLGEIEPRYSGYIGWRGLISEADLSAETFASLNDAITYGLIEHSHIVAYPIPNVDGRLVPGERLVNYVWYRNVEAGPELDDLMTGRDGVCRPISLQPGNVQGRFLSQLAEDARASLAAPLAEMVERSPEPFIQVIVDLESPAMAFGRIALLGDGAFAARPHAAAGTAKAAENGWQLVDFLEQVDGDVVAALKAWEPGQLRLGRELVTRSRKIGERSQVHGTWIPGDPELKFGLYGPGR